MEGLDERLAAATDAAAAAEMCCEALATLPGLLPSVYVERSGRLRCISSRGYWQVLDGFPPDAGVIATTYRTGQPQLIEQPEEHEDFLRAIPGIVAEASVPVRLGGQVIGVVNVETHHALPVDVLATLEEVAQQFAARVAAQGGLDEPEGWPLLADRAVMLTDLRSAADVTSSVVDLGRQLMGTSSGLVALRQPGEEFVVDVVQGPLGSALRSLSHESLCEIAGWVDGALSCYSLGRPEGHGFSDHDELRASGVHTLVVTSLRARGENLGFLLLADHRSALPSTAQVEQLELFGTLAAQTLCTIRLVAQLEDRASRDPLTGLGHATAFGRTLARTRDPGLGQIAILVLDIDRFKQVNDTQGHLEGDRLLRSLASALSEALRRDDLLYRIGGDEFAALIEIRTQDEARSVAGRLLDAARAAGATISIGVTTGRAGDRREADLTLLAAADAALYRVKDRGGDGYELSGGDGEADALRLQRFGAIADELRRSRNTATATTAAAAAADRA